MSKRVLGPALTAAYKISPELAAVLGGKSQATRQEALKGVWSYLKTNGLQDPKAKRTIIGDDKLTALFGKKTLTMFEVMRLMNPSFLKKIE